jgi:type IV pilus assembly protein PilP
MKIKSNNTSKLPLLFLCLIGLLLCACGPTEDDELRKYIEEIKARKSRPIEPIPEFQTLPKFQYPEQEIRRSPFKPIVLVNETQIDSKAPNLDRPKQPLENFPLDALKFVGTLKEGKIIWALISQPDGTISRIKTGEYMGKNFGQVLEINNETITLVETLQIGGKWEKKTINLKLITTPNNKS